MTTIVDGYTLQASGYIKNTDKSGPYAIPSSGTPQLVNAPQGNVAAGATDSGNPVKVGGVYSATLPTYTDGQRSNVHTSSRGEVLVALSQGATTALIGTPSDGQTVANGVATRSQNQVFNGSNWDRMTKPNATSRLLSSAATTNGTSVKAAAGNVMRIRGLNTVASKRYLKFYNKASAPTVGTDTPVLTFVILASAEFVIDLGGANGHYFSTGIAYAITGAAADADTTAISSGDIECMNITYS